MFFSRGKNHIQDPYTIPDFYKEYIKDKESSSPYKVSYSVYRDILVRYYKKITNRVLDDGLPFKMPCNLGELKIVKKKMNYSALDKGNCVDWVNTVKYGKKIYHINEHSDGYKYLFMWNKAKAKLKNITKYRFKPTRDNKRTLATYIKERIKDYFEL